MKHAASRELYAYWDERRGKRPAPERAEIEPGAIRQVLSDAFILALDGGAGHPFRLAGTRVCALFGRELKSEPFIGLWAAASQPTIADLITILDEERVGTVAGVTAQNDERRANRSRTLAPAAQFDATEPRPGHRNPGAAQGAEMARVEPARRAQSRAAPAYRRVAAKPHPAALYGAAAASIRHSRRRPFLAPHPRRLPWIRGLTGR